MAEETEVIKVRIPVVDKKKLEKHARSEYRTFAAQVRYALAKWLEESRQTEWK